jgi:hypothetical protein
MVFKRGKVAWYHFWCNGEHIQESTHQPSLQVARDIEAAHRVALAKGEAGLEPVSRVRYDDLALALEDDYKANGRRSLNSLLGRLAHLKAVFGGRLARTITASDVRAYRKQRQAEGAANGTINRELAALKRMFNLAIESDILKDKPKIPMLRRRRRRKYSRYPPSSRRS